MTSKAVLTTSSIPMTAEIMPANDQDSVFSFTLKTATSDSIESYIEDFNNLKRATGRAILKMAHLVFHVESVHTKADKEAFAIACNLDRTSASYAKWKTLGQNVSRFNLVENQCLPNHWTTLYALAKLTTEHFNLVADKLSSDITMIAINKMLPSVNKDELEEKATVTLQLKKINEFTLDRVRQVTKLFGADTSFSDVFTVQYSTRVETALAASRASLEI